NDPKGECSCLPGQILKYNKKISGPLLDRIDLHIAVPKINFEKLEDNSIGESSAIIHARVQKARDIQTERFKDLNIVTNAEMSSQMIKKYCVVDEESKNLLRLAVNQKNLSARGYFRVLKIARTIADINGDEHINPNNICEALQYRPEMD
ncbi:MAG: ATP-binding protein, partial [Parcubacteria group bacterium]|nr:ATP-binding protein [Parcubacteria group bacterium]